MFLLVVFVGGCDLFSGKSELSGDGDNKTNTSLSTSLANVSLIPARHLKAMGVTIAEGHAIYLVWDSVQFAKSYNIYASDNSDGEFTLIGTSDSCEYYDMLPSSLSITAVNKFYKVAGVNQNEKEGALSAVVNGHFQISGSYDKKVEAVSVSKGDSSGIRVSWTSEPSAFSYKIMRVKSGDIYDNAVVAREVYVPVDNTVSMLEWTDRSVSPGVIYDYYVICVDENGVMGQRSGVGKEGFVRPYPQVVFVGPSSVRGGSYSYIDIFWETLWRLENVNGPVVGSEPALDTGEDSLFWKVALTDNPIEGIYFVMSSLPDYLNWLKASHTHPNFGDKLPGNEGVDNSDSDLQTNPQKWTKDAHDPSLLKRFKNGDASLNTIEYCYRILVNNAAHFDRPVYFVVSAIYKKGYFNEFETPTSAMQEGFAIKPSVTINAPTSVTATSEQAGVVSISWNGVSGASRYIVCRKKATDYNFTKVQEVSGTSFVDGNGNEENSVASGIWYYSIRAVNGSGESEFSMPVEVKVQ